jgi:hypothetical protein
MNGLRADIQNVTAGPGKTYIVTIYLRNSLGDKPLYVMAPVVRGFVQVGSSWQEVSMKAANSATPKILKVTGNQLYKYILEPDVSGYAELLPYYMHVRIYLYKTVSKIMGDRIHTVTFHISLQLSF